MNIRAIGNGSNNEHYQKKNVETTETTFAQFLMQKDAMIKEHHEAMGKQKNNDDWRTMDPKKWNDIIEHVDQYLDGVKEDLKQVKEEQDEEALKETSLRENSHL